MANDVQRLKSSLAKMGVATSRRYTDPELRQQIIDVAAKSKRPQSVLAKDVGISWTAFKRILEEGADPSGDAGKAKASKLAKSSRAAATPTNGHMPTNGHAQPPVRAANRLQLEAAVSGASLTLVTPSGHRVEGLDVYTMAMLLTKL